MQFTERLRKNRDFIRARKLGRPRANELLVLHVLANGPDVNRVGFTVGKKVGKSVVRSRVTRLLRENYRLMEHGLSRGYDLVFIARTAASGAGYYEIGASMRNLLKRAGLFTGA